MTVTDFQFITELYNDILRYRFGMNKYLKTQDENKIDEMYSQFISYFQNTEIRENIPNSKEEQFQEGFFKRIVCQNFGIYFESQTE